MQRGLNAVMGLALGLVTLPVFAVAWPLFAAWWLWQETDED